MLPDVTALPDISVEFADGEVIRGLAP